MTAITNLTVAPLPAYVPSDSNPWNARKVSHLYRRAGFGASIDTINQALQLSPSQVVDAMMDEAISLPLTPAPEWAEWDRRDWGNRRFRTDRNRWRNQMIRDLYTNGLRDRMTLFWSNHFVTEAGDDSGQYRSPSYMFRYHTKLQEYALGNFKELTRVIGLTDAMLAYLNGSVNEKENPNENYARELYELFTLGVDNGYTQTDIEETARALTGYKKVGDRWGGHAYDASRFDDTPKTIFGKTGNYGYDEVIDLLFEEKSTLIANFICGKIYDHFVGPVQNNESKSDIESLAQIFIENSFEIAPVLSSIFKSERFFSAAVSGVIIKSPLDLKVTFVNDTGFFYGDEGDLMNEIRGYATRLGQEVFTPVDVAGWQEDRSWISTNRIALRWGVMRALIRTAWGKDEEQFRVLVKDIVGGNSGDVEKVSRSIVNFFIPKNLHIQLDYAEALEIFKDDVPDGYFEDGTWNLDFDRVPTQTYQLLIFIVKLPEFQLK